MITVEDVNGSVYRDGSESYIAEIDTSLISDESDFTNVVYDFCKVSRSSTTSGGSTTYHYTFEIHNKDWTGAYYLRYPNGNYLYNNGSYDSETSKLTYDSSYTSIKLYLYCSALATDFSFKRLQYIPFEPFPTDLTLEEFGTYTKKLWNMGTNSETSQVAQFTITSPGVYSWTSSTANVEATLYYLARLVKTDFVFECTQDLICGQVNTVSLGAGTKYKPGGALVGNYAPNIIVNYNGNVIPVTYDEDIGDYVFDLDLSNINTPGKVKFTVQVEGNKVVNNSEALVRLDVDVHIISTFNELRVACDTDGPAIIKLSSNLTGLTSNIPVKHSMKIIGNNKSIGLNEHSIILNDNTSLIVEDCNFNIGNPAFIQGKNTILNLVY